MTITDAMVLAPDVLVIRVRDLPPPYREQVGDDDAFALTRARGRAPSSLVDEPTAELLREFRSPSTIVEAVIRYSRRLDLDPERVLAESYPSLRQCLGRGYLVAAGSERAEPWEATLATGQRVAGGAVVRCVHALEDTELYQLALDDGGLAALKLSRPGVATFAEEALRREVEVLRRLKGRVAPRLLGAGEHDGRPWLLVEWCDGTRVDVSAARLRRTGADGELVDLCRRVAEAYAGLHELGVVHGDVHGGNVLVSAAGVVRVVDFGLARSAGGPDEPPRGGVQAFFEPEHAAALLARRPAPPATPVAEQYSVAALLYELLTGSAYLDFSLEHSEMLRQIVEDAPLPFTRRGRRPWPEVEGPLAVALAKDPRRRLPATAELARRLAAATPPVVTSRGAGMEALLGSVLAKLRPGGEWFEGGLPEAPFCSVVYGAAGIAAALRRVGMLRADPELVSLADEWVVRAAREAGRAGAFVSEDREMDDELVGPVTPFHRVTGVHAVQALVSHALGDAGARQRALDAFVAASRQPCDRLDLTLGRAGTLLGAALLLETIVAAPYAELGPLVRLGNETLASLWSELDAMPPIADGTAVTYLGVAHGWAGLLLATLRWCAAAGVAAPAAVVDRLDQLARLARPAGMGVRWPWANRHERLGAVPTVPGWCNGSAGHVHLWTTAHAFLGGDRWLALAERAGWDVYATRNDIAHLCCGGAGQAYALLDLYRHTGSRRWLTAATELAAGSVAATAAAGPETSVAWSLHKGAVGVAVLAAELDDPETAAMPFFAFEG